MDFVITNNPKVLPLYPSARWIDGGPLEVYLECRRKVQEGYPLLNSPLMGDIHLLHNPFRTVILNAKKGEADLMSVIWIEESIERIRLFHRRPRSEYLEDYQTLDLDLFQSAIDQNH